MADSSQISSSLTESTNSTIYRLDGSSLDKTTRMDDSINSESFAGSSMLTTDSLTIEDFPGFTAGDPESDHHASDPFQGILYHMMPLQDSTSILFYNKPIFNNILSVLSKQFTFPSEGTKKFQLKTYLGKSKCYIGIDTVVMSICASGPGHALWKEKCFKQLAVNVFKHFVEETNKLLNTNQVNDTLSTSQISTQNPEDINEIIINETVEEAQPPAEPVAQQPEHMAFTHLHDSPVIRKISVLMDMISTMQGEMAKLTKEVNDLVLQHASQHSLYRTVDQTSISSPTLNHSRDNQDNEEPHGEASHEVPVNDGASLAKTPNASNGNLLSPSSELPDLQTRQYSEVARRTSTPREQNQTPHRPRPEPQPHVPTSSPRPGPRTSHNDHSDQILLIGDSLISSVNPKGLKQNVIKKGISGGNIDRLTTQVKIYDIRKFSHLIIYIGGNDASNGTDIEYFKHAYDELIQYVKDSNEQCKIIICNTCPRGDTSTSEVNDIIRTLAEHHHVCLIDQDRAFYNRHGKIIESYYDSDCIHLSSSGVKRLLGTINNEIRIVHEFDKCVFSRRRENRSPPQHTRSTRGSNLPARLRDNNRQRDNNVNQQERLRLCYKCGESNHDTSSCTHRQQLKCFHCGFLGHKSGRCLQVV